MIVILSLYVVGFDSSRGFWRLDPNVSFKSVGDVNLVPLALDVAISNSISVVHTKSLMVTFNDCVANLLAAGNAVHGLKSLENDLVLLA